MKSAGWLLLFVVISLSACTNSIKPADLYGRWKYVKVEHPNQGPSADTPDEELKEQDPSIVFSQNGDLQMIWGGKILSSGKFKLEGPYIVYTENLSGNSVRDIRFLIKKFEDNKLVFQTMEADAIRVTAQKVGSSQE